MIHWLIGAVWLCSTNTSQPRTESRKRTKISPLAKSNSLLGVGSMPRQEATSSASSGNARPETRIIRFSLAAWMPLIRLAPPARSRLFRLARSAGSASAVPSRQGRLGRGRGGRARRRRVTQPGMFRCPARPMPSAPGGTSWVMTEPAAVYAPSPISTGATSIVSLPIRTWSPTRVRCLATPS